MDKIPCVIGAVFTVNLSPLEPICCVKEILYNEHKNEFENDFMKLTLAFLQKNFIKNVM